MNGTLNPSVGTGLITTSHDGSQTYAVAGASNAVVAVDTSAAPYGVNTISVGTSPWQVGFTPDSVLAYVTNSGSGTVSVINTWNRAVVQTITVGNGPRGISVGYTANGLFAYVANTDDGTVSVIDEFDAVVATIPVGAGPRSVAMSADGTAVYVSNAAAGTISEISTSTNTVTATITMPGSTPPGYLVASPDGQRLYVAITGSVLAFSTPANTYLGSIVENAVPVQLLVSSDSQTLFVPTSANDHKTYLYSTADFASGQAAAIDSFQVGTGSSIGISLQASTAQYFVTTGGQIYLFYGEGNTLPRAPTAVSATGGDTRAGVTWSAPANTGGSAITFYSVRAISGGSPVSGATCYLASPFSSPLTCDITGLTNGTAYTFEVMATNTYGDSFWSVASSSVTPALAVPGLPGTPTAVTGNAQATVTVTASSSGGTPTSYTVTATDLTAVGRGGQTCTVTGASGSCTLTGLTNGDSYTFTSTATGAGGTSSASAASNAVVPTAPAVLPPPPLPVALTSTGTGAQSVTLSIPAGGVAALLDGVTAATTVTIPGQGTYSLAGEVLTFTPVAGFSGLPTPVTFRLTDRHYRSGQATYQPEVTPAPVTGAQPATQTGAKGDPQSVTPLADFTPPAGEQLLPETLRIIDPRTGTSRFDIVTGQGAWTVDPATGVVTFAPGSNFVGVATITYTVNTTTGGSEGAGVRASTSRTYTSTISIVVTGTANYRASATVHFRTGSAKLTITAERSIHTLSAKLAATATRRAVTIGYPHPAGSSDRHEALSRSRAKATAKTVATEVDPATLSYTRKNTRRHDGPAARRVTITLTWTLTQA